VKVGEELALYGLQMAVVTVPGEVPATSGGTFPTVYISFNNNFYNVLFIRVPGCL
jgi:hypothetical protein